MWSGNSNMIKVTKYLNYITLIINYESKAHLYKISMWINGWNFWKFFFFFANLLYQFFVWFQKQELDTAAEDNNKATLAMQGKQNKTKQTHLNAIPLSIWAFICIPVIWTCANVNSFATSFLHVCEINQPSQRRHNSQRHTFTCSVVQFVWKFGENDHFSTNTATWAPLWLLLFGGRNGKEH